MIARGIMAGTLRGRRRLGLGPTWDRRYHRYLDGMGGSWNYGPEIHFVRLPEPEELPDAFQESFELRQAS